MSEPEFVEFSTQHGVQRPAPYEGVITDYWSEQEATDSAAFMNVTHPDREGDWIPVHRTVTYGEWQHG